MSDFQKSIKAKKDSYKAVKMFNRGRGQKRNGWSGRRQGTQGKSQRGGKKLHTGRAPVDMAKFTKDRETFFEAVKESSDRVDSDFGFDLFSQGDPRLGWLLNMLPTSVSSTPGGADPTAVKNAATTDLAALELYFLQQDGSTFKAVVLYQPYFYLIVHEKWVKEVKSMLQRRFSDLVASVEVTLMEDLDLPNHLSGKKLECLKLSFPNVNNLMTVRKEMFPVVQHNAKHAKSNEAYATEIDADEPPEDLLEAIMDIREYDVSYYTRVSIDLEINVGSWYLVKPRVWDGTNPNGLGVDLEKQDIVEKAEPRILAFDIECTKQPLKFPEAETDQIFMISYMFDGQGYLIINREIVSEDIDDFEYTPKPEYPGPFIIFNERNEEALIKRFFLHARELKPNIWVTYNGDFFDWPFVDRRAQIYDIDMRSEIGIGKSSANEGEYRGRCSVHIDCFYWVQRDSYLPAGSRGLKAVTKAKLGYDPVEVDPEDMLRFAQEKPHHMAAYSVSDAVATYYLFDKYVNLFIFSLCTIIPLGPDDILRKGSGTLCEMLLMVEARRGNIICPNKQIDMSQKYTENGQLLEQDTYIGGHVECLETGVYRDDLPEKFRLDSAAFEELIQNIDRDLTFAIEVESGVSRMEVLNYDEVRDQIIEELELLRDTPVRMEKPTIYHLDVAAMYPNIILTNRLQPCAIVNEETCASCAYNTGPDASCKRNMDWMWRGEYYPCKKEEIAVIKNQLTIEMFEAPENQYGVADGKVPYSQLAKSKQSAILRQRIKSYCRTAYRRVKDTSIVEKQATVCQRENPFYVNTVKAFRDRRYDYKGFTKEWTKKKAALENNDSDPLLVEEARNKVLIFDSLQLAHKCILNSFYGYVMRKGARWHSMEMAGVVTHTGGNIIKQARKLVERIGRPLELDTDGIWCILPGSFPENYAFKTKTGGKIAISYPCVMLNADVHANFTNDQYQDLTAKGGYDTHSECSIYFEVDGPYRCMVLPASQEEGKLLKKRYAVFNHDGSLAELKGFEIKRRGELEIIKTFQSQVFEKFLSGDTLVECYAAVAEVANKWLDVLQSKGKHLTDAEVIRLISENRSMSRALSDYADQKSTSISTAKRLAEFLGADMVKNAGLACKLLIANKPVGAPTTERAIPTAIFSAEEGVKKHFLCKWLKDNGLDSFDVRSIIDWDYYVDRLGKTVQKIITIPAALQSIPNPVPRVKHPDWLQRNIREVNDTFKQRKINSMFTALPPGETLPPLECSKVLADIEDIVVDTPVVSGDEEEEMDDITSRVAFLKKRWKERREEKATKASQLMGFPTGDLSGFIQKRASPQGYWQIVEIREQKTPGLFKVFLMYSSTQMQSVYVNLPRVFYVNSTVEEKGQDIPADAIIQRVNKHLPHSHTAYFLYKITMDESVFMHNKKLLTNFITKPNIVGVYEMNLDLRTRLINYLGCVARVYPSCARDLTLAKITGGTSKRPFATLELERLVCTTHGYLDQSESKRIYCYHAGTGRKQIVAMFQVDESLTELQERCNFEAEDDDEIVSLMRVFPRGSKCHVWVSSGKGDRPNARRILQNMCQLSGIQEDFTQVDTEQVDHPDMCWKGLGRELNKYISERHGATILLFQSSFSSNQLQAKIGGAIGQFPLVHIPGHGEDDEPPALQWTQYLTKNAVERFVAHPLWLQDRLKAARYAHLPLAHVGQDFAVTMADTFFMRLLDFNKHVLWATSACIPDLGGVENDITLEEEEEEAPHVTSAGSYRSYCVEIDIVHLAVNTMIQASRIHDIECADGSLALEQLSVGNANQKLDPDGKLIGNNSHTPGIIGSANECLTQFKILKVMISNWFGDVNSSDGVFADQLLVHFYRWLCSPKSLLYDPALHMFVYRLMKKVFLQLLAEIRRLGAKIIHASFQKIWISTCKHDAKAAQSYTEHIIQTISSKPLFENLGLQVAKYWQGLLFFDEANYGGVIDNPYFVPEVDKISEDGRDDAEEFDEVSADNLSEGERGDVDKISADNLSEGDRYLDIDSVESVGGDDAKKRKRSEEDGPRRLRKRGFDGNVVTDRKQAQNEHLEREFDRERRMKAGEEVSDDDEEDQVLEDDLDDFIVDDEEKDVYGEENNTKYEVILNWNICTYLPIELQDHFSYIVGYFILEPIKYRDLWYDEQAKQLKPLEGDLIATIRVEDSEFAQAMSNFISHLVEADIGQKLLRMIPQISASMASLSEFPVLAGSHLKMKNAALEFVKSICAVLALDVPVRHHVDVLKRSLLRLLDFKEFSPLAQFENPSLKLTMRDVVCTYCNYCTDLDLCRDIHLLQSTNDREDSPFVWKCMQCSQPYDMPAIEHLLVQRLEKMNSKFQVQDMLCVKCGQTRAESMSEGCQCSGQWSCCTSVAQQQLLYLPFLNVAKYYNFEWLQEVAQASHGFLVAPSY